MRSRILIPVVALIVATQACCCTGLGGQQPPYPITPSDEAVQRFKERLESATPGQDGTFTLTVTDEEITSLVAQRLAGQQQQGRTIPVSDPQIYFRNDCVEAYATLHLSDTLAVPGMIAMSVTVEDGLPVFTIEEIDIGPLPVPAPLLEELTNQMNQMLAESLGHAETTITGIQIGEGQMTLTAQAATGD